MASKFTIKQVISDLRQFGYIIRKHPSTPSLWQEGDTLYTERRLYKLHKLFLQKGNSYKGIVKKLSNGKDRSATRDALITEKFDNIPTNKRLKEEDSWGWD